MKIMFHKKGAFIVSILKENGEENQVTDEVRASWSPLWQEVDSEFEKDLSGNSDWEFMRNKMFFVWERNYQTIAWSDCYKDTKSRHIRVLCSLIDPTRVSKIALLASLQRGNSDVWKEKVFSLRFEGKDCIITLGKLKILALTKMRVEKRVNLLCIFEASGWLAKEVFLEKIECAAIVTLGDFSSLYDLRSPMFLPHDYPLQAYMEEIKLEAKNHMFVSMRTRDSKSKYKGTRKEESSQSKAMKLDQAAQRVVYRYLFALVKEGKLKELPVKCLPWCDLESVSCMYPPNMRDLSSWELANDPWWIDLKPEVILAREQNIFKLHGHGKQVISLGKEKKDKNTKIVETHDAELDIEMEVANTVKNAHETRELAKDGIILFKELCILAYSMVSPGDLAYHGDAPFYGCDVGDYIAMGQDFVNGKNNEVYTRIHEFFLAIGIGKDYCQMGRKVKWVADFIFLDFPIGFGLESIQGVPEWKRLTKEHVRYGVTVAAASLAYHGWLVMMAPLIGLCITWIEHYVCIQGLKIGRRVFVLEKVAYGLVNEEGENISVAYVLFFVHHLDTHPKKFYDASKAIFKKLHILQDSDWWTHFLPDAKKTVLSRMVAI
ncbi:hypothetical protein L7F22_016946 [Adiantum nelumboides]|nr:hypothetical protein [Adiantum nelumboides]